MNNDNIKNKKPRSKAVRFFVTLFVVLLVIAAAWVAFSLIGRVNAASVIPDSASLRISISNPVRLLDNVMAHESLHEIVSMPALEQVMPMLDMAQGLLKNRIVRLIASGNVEFAVLQQGFAQTGFAQTGFAAAMDMGLFSPLLRILPAVSGFVNIPNLYYVQAGKNSRFEFRLNDMTLFIGPYRNLLFISDNTSIFESRSADYTASVFSSIKPSAYDAALVLSGEFINTLLADQDPDIAAILNNVEFDSLVEAGLSIYPKKIEFRLAAPLSSREQSLSRILQQRSRVPGLAETIPADAQYATILSAGTLNELYQTALVFSPALDDALKTAETASRFLLGLSLNDLLFSWSGNEFAVFGLEGRPHPVYAIQIADERKRQEVFDKAFRSIVLGENVRLNIDGVRIPRIEVPEFLQSLLRQWDIFIPSPYYVVHRDFILASESADTLLAALRAMQRNDVLPKTAIWREIAGGKTVTSAFSLYYSLDLSVPFFLRKNTDLSKFLSLYRHGLIRISFDRGAVDLSLSLIPGSGNGVMPVSGYPLNIGGRPFNRIYGGEKSRIFFTSGGTAISLDITDNRMYELPGQGTHWVISAGADNVWVVTDRGRVTLADGNMDAAPGFPIITGLRLSSPPQVHEGRLYLCDEDGKVHIVDENGRQGVWETSFAAAVRSPPSFLTVSARRNTSAVYAAVYPKSFFGEIWLLDADGRSLPNWPAPISVNDEDNDFGVGFGSPLLFAHNNRVLVAFINQQGQLLVYDENASLVQPFPLVLNGIFYQQPVFDGEYLWLVSSNGNLFRISLHGEVLHQSIPGLTVMEEGYLTVFENEIYITGDGNALYAYTRHFRSLEGFPLPVWGKPLFIPAQGNKKAEIFGIGMDRRLYRWQFR
ncbi:MAG: PQQ-like beta-propeller repeat protein [Treponema sp.]|nr:PQQ-like beta-propeller repeat protein [Treponema sp.]